jgi:nicotinate phosphoribosyltransferase
MEKRKRLPIETFDTPVQDLRRGYYSAVYFWREKQILEKMNYGKKVVMQVFQKNDAVLCGIDEAIAVLKLCSGYYEKPELAFPLFDIYKKQERLIRKIQAQRNYLGLARALQGKIDLETELDDLWVDKSAELDIQALNDCDPISPWETVMTIRGLPQYFAHLESIYLGILARRTLVATNVANVVEAAQGKPILFFADRFDHYRNQTGDGYAAMCGGVKGVATDNMGEWWGNQGSGTMPHALIACFNGNTVAATLAFAKQYPEVPCISLVDFHNDCASTAIDVAHAFKTSGLKLWGVRLDTSENMVDASIYQHDQMGSEKPTGVNPLLVNNVRKALDCRGFDDVKIIVSGGFNKDKIRYFESKKVPVDAYGCGSSLLKGGNDFTADIVVVDGRYCGKVGRWERPNTKLELA